MNSIRPSPVSGAYFESLATLERHVDLIPFGWQRLYADLRHQLRAIATSRRADVRVDGAWEEDGLLRLESQTGDVVVQGVLRKARARASSTCTDCGRPAKHRELLDWYEVTLCAGCAALPLLQMQVKRAISLHRCESVDLREELLHSRDATLIRAAAVGSDVDLEALEESAALDWLTSLLTRTTSAIK